VQTLTEIKTLLAARGLRPKHRLGQNFLHDKNQLTKLIDAAEVKPGDLVLEVGPGTGTLTGALLERGAEVIACELDADMAAIIREVFAERILADLRDDRGRGRPGSLRLVEGDCLGDPRTLNPAIIAAVAGRPFKLVANLPYQAASPLMSALLIEHDGCLGQFITIQKEVADRLRARPSNKEYGPLSIIVQAMAEVRLLSTLSPGCFWPQPEVTSAMVAVIPLPQQVGSALPSAIDCRAFARFITELFTQRRKQLGGTLGRDAAPWNSLQSIGITPDLRPEALPPALLVQLWLAFRTG